MTLEIRVAKMEEAMALMPAGVDPAMYEIWMREHFTRGPAWSAVCPDGLVGCSGAAILWPGVAMGWAVFDPGLLRKNLLSVVRAYRWFIPDVMRRNGLRRLHTHVYDRPCLLRWAKALGFEQEGVMKAYAPDGADCWMCSIVRGGGYGSVDT